MKEQNKEFDLSKKIKGYDPITQIVVRGDVKEFIKRLKEETNPTMSYNAIIKKLDKLAGSDLI